MERRLGTVVRREVPPEFGGGDDPVANRKLSEVVVDALADFHAVDPVKAGLGDLGKPDGYLQRQVSGWTQRWERAKTREMPAAPEVIAWLESHMPASPPATLVHNEGDMLLGIGQTARAESLLHEALLQVARSDPSGHIPEQPLIHYGHAALFQGDADSAAKYFGMLATQAVGDRNTYWQGRGLFGLALAQLQLGKLDDARRSAAALEAIEKRLSIRSVDDQITDSRIIDARLAMERHDPAAARTAVEDALRDQGYFDGKRRRVYHAALVLAAEAALGTHQPAAALRYARDARDVSALDSATVPSDAFVGEAQLVEARALLATGDTASARLALDSAVAELHAGAGDAQARSVEAARLRAALR